MCHDCYLAFGVFFAAALAGAAFSVDGVSAAGFALAFAGFGLAGFSATLAGPSASCGGLACAWLSGAGFSVGWVATLAPPADSVAAAGVAGAASAGLAALDAFAGAFFSSL